MLNEPVAIKFFTSKNDSFADGSAVNSVDAVCLLMQTPETNLTMEVTSGSAVFSKNAKQILNFTIKSSQVGFVFRFYLSSVNVEKSVVTLKDDEGNVLSSTTVNFTTPEIIELQTLTDAWGEWFAEENNTTCKFTSSTDYSKHAELNDYQSNQCIATYKDINYDSPSISPTDPISASDQVLKNGTDIEQTETYAWEKSTTNSFTWSLTESLKIGVETTFICGVPEIAEGKIKTTVELDLSSTQSQTTSDTQKWSLSVPVRVPAHSGVECISVIEQSMCELAFTAEINLSGYVAVWFDDQVDGHWLRFVEISRVIREIVDNNLMSTYSYTIGEKVVIAHSKGKTNGTYGTQINTTYNPIPATTYAS